MSTEQTDFDNSKLVAELTWLGTRQPGITYPAAGRPLSVNEMKDAVVRLFAEANRANLDVFHELLSADFISYGGAGFQDLNGPELFKQLYLQYLQGLEGLAFNVTHIVVEGDIAGVRGVLSGNHTGNFMGFAPPTGRHVCWTGTALMRFNRAGMIDARWQEWDGLSIMQQLGVVPGMPSFDAGRPDPLAPQVVSGAYISPTDNKAAFTQMVDELWNKGNLAFAEKVIHPEAVLVSHPELPAGPQGLQAFVGMLRSAMPDLRTDMTMLLADGDLVLGWFSQTGTQTGALMTVPPSGKKASWGQIIIARFAGGKIIQAWTNEDMLGLMGQLGVGAGQTAGA